MVEAGGADVGEGLAGDEGGVVFLERGFCSRGTAELLHESPFVDNVVAGGVLLEEGGRDEGLEVEPAADVDAADGVFAVAKVVFEVGDLLVGLDVVVPRGVETD